MIQALKKEARGPENQVILIVWPWKEFQHANSTIQGVYIDLPSTHHQESHTPFQQTCACHKMVAYKNKQHLLIIIH